MCLSDSRERGGGIEIGLVLKKHEMKVFASCLHYFPKVLKLFKAAFLARLRMFKDMRPIS
jgi:hypothetical protein